MYELSDEEDDDSVEDEVNCVEDEVNGTEDIEDGDDTNIAEKDFGELDEMIVPDNEIENFNRISEDKINNDNRDFVEKIHNYYDTWDSWTPETPLQISLRDAINKIK
jgi:hypothetical protein